MENLTLKIKEFWDRRALSYKLDPKVGWDDLNMNRLELRVLEGYIKNGDKILDAGCATGDAIHYISKRKKVSAVGIDYSEPMINFARASLDREHQDQSRHISFGIADVCELNNFSDASFDTIISKRCLINIVNWEDQKKALLEFYRLLKQNGLLLLVEGTQEGLNRLNRVRKIFSLSDIEVCWHNRFLREGELFDFTRDYFDPLKIENFCSTYMLLTRAIQPLVSKQFDYNSLFNAIASRLFLPGNFGYIKLIVLRKQ